MSDEHLLIGPPPERWIIVAFKAGRWKGLVRLDGIQLFPKHRDTFPICGSRQEAHERIAIKKGTDPAFARRWNGWFLAPVSLNDAVQFGDDIFEAFSGAA